MKKFLIILINIVFLITTCVLPEDLETTADENNLNNAPIIVSYSPDAHVININLREGDAPKELDFFVDAEDPDGDVLSYKWEVLDCNDSSCKIDIEATDTKNYSYIASLPPKDLFVGVEVSDSINNIYHYWILKIQRIF